MFNVRGTLAAICGECQFTSIDKILWIATTHRPLALRDGENVNLPSETGARRVVSDFEGYQYIDLIGLKPSGPSESGDFTNRLNGRPCRRRLPCQVACDRYPSCRR